MNNQHNQSQNQKSTIAFQDISIEVKDNPKLKNSQPTPKPEDFEEIEY